MVKYTAPRAKAVDGLSNLDLAQEQYRKDFEDYL